MKSRALECQFLSDDMSGVSLVERTISDPSEKEILIAIKASSVNFPDYLMTQGKYQHKPELPFGLGMEGSGIVKKTGNEVSKFKVGDEVTFGALGKGAFSDFIVVDERAAELKPSNLTFEKAAAFQTAYLTAYVSLVCRGDLKKGETLLVHGSTGGVGDSFVTESALHFLYISEKSNVVSFKNDQISLTSSNFDDLPTSKSIKTMHF